jgi:hypothetical protein
VMVWRYLVCWGRQPTSVAKTNPSVRSKDKVVGRQCPPFRWTWPLYQNLPLPISLPNHLFWYSQDKYPILSNLKHRSPLPDFF